MDDLLNFNNDLQTETLTEIDKVIRIKYFKEKNKNKTYIYGLYDFISDKDINKLVKDIKKRLGCAGIISNESSAKDKKIIIFSGDQVTNIKNIIMEKNIADSSRIKF